MVSYEGRNDPALILLWAYSVVRTRCLERSNRSNAFLALIVNYLNHGSRPDDHAVNITFLQQLR